MLAAQVLIAATLIAATAPPDGAQPRPDDAEDIENIPAGYPPQTPQDQNSAAPEDAADLPPVVAPTPAPESGQEASEEPTQHPPATKPTSEVQSSDAAPPGPAGWARLLAIGIAVFPAVFAPLPALLLLGPWFYWLYATREEMLNYRGNPGDGLGCSTACSNTCCGGIGGCVVSGCTWAVCSAVLPPVGGLILGLAWPRDRGSSESGQPAHPPKPSPLQAALAFSWAPVVANLALMAVSLAAAVGALVVIAMTYQRWSEAQAGRPGEDARQAYRRDVTGGRNFWLVVAGVLALLAGAAGLAVGASTLTATAAAWLLTAPWFRSLVLPSRKAHTRGKRRTRP